MAKRTIDVLFAALGLLLASPLVALIGLAIKLDSPGPVIFSQRRLGKGGKPFRLRKFRKFPATWGSAGPGVTVAGDARMTRIGRVLERTKLDELPQLWNILLGEMSFVGPRPESLRYAELFSGDLAEVLEYVPGVFGPNQVAFRNESQMYPPDQDPEVFYRSVLFPRKAKADIAYARGASIVTDTAWIVRGIWSSLAGAIDWQRAIRLQGPILVLDLICIEAAWLIANLIRFEGVPYGGNWPVFVTGFWLFPAVLLPVMVLDGVYRHPIRFFSLGDALRLALATTLGWTLAYLLMVGLLYRNASFFLAPFGLLLALSLMGAVRLLRRQSWRTRSRAVRRDQLVRIIVYGAGSRGSSLVSFLEQGFRGANVIGFLDDDDSFLRGRTVVGHPILGSERDLGTVQAVHSTDQLWMTFEPETHKHRRLQHWCDANGVKLVIVPLVEPFRALCDPSPDSVTVQLPARSISSERPAAHGDRARGIA